MLSLKQIEQDLVTALKARDSVAANTLRGLKTRIQNEQISKMKELGEPDIIALIRSEVKKRRESAEAFEKGDRAQAAEKERAESSILEKYLPAQMDEAKLAVMIEASIEENSFTAKDFGKAMSKLKAQVGDQADGSTLAKLLKEKLK